MPTTLFDKLWANHAIRVDDNGETLLFIDRICLHERTGSIAMTSLAERDLPVRRPENAFCIMDHIVDTNPGRGDATQMPGGEAFIASTRASAQQFGLRTFDVTDPDQGISHVVSAEQGIALPGVTLICPDSHTCTLGGLGALAFGIGTSQAEHALATSTLWVAKPKNLSIEFSGALKPGISAKDMVLHLIGQHGANLGAGCAVEFSGSAVRELTIEARMTLCNMAVEFAAFTAVVAPDEKTLTYVADRPYSPAQLPEAEWLSLKSDSDAHFDECIQVDAANIDHRVTWGTSPEHGCAISDTVPEPVDEAQSKALAYMGLTPGTAVSDIAIDAAFIGSCTNARLSDLIVAADILRGHTLADGVTGVVVPGSTTVKREAEALGLNQVFTAAGFEWRESGCSMCFYAGGETFGPGKRVISTTNRNFEGRQGPGTRTHLASPAVVAASAVRGRISGPEQR